MLQRYITSAKEHHCAFQLKKYAKYWDESMSLKINILIGQVFNMCFNWFY